MGYLLTTGAEPCNGLLDMSMLEPAGWRQPPYAMPGRHFGAAFFGDPESGPFVALNAVEPLEECYAPAPGRGHRSDSWRISISGLLRVGAQRYQAGGFRFQEAGLLYGADDVGWSPDGAQSVVMMADRRGSSAIPANPADQARFTRAGKRFDRWLGLGPRREHPTVTGVATTLGAPKFGRVDGSFAQSAAWREQAPGVRWAIGLCGDRTCGPVVLLIAAGDGKVAIPELRLPTEVMHIVCGGNATSNDRTLQAAEVRMVEAKASGPVFRAGASYLWLSTVIGDRRMLAEAKCADDDWLKDLKDTVKGLTTAWPA